MVEFLNSFQRDERLFSLLFGKRVALVGPSPHLVNRYCGEDIDKYDIVCRINEVLPLGYTNDYGSKTDIVFYNCARNYMPEFVCKMRASEAITKVLVGAKSVAQDCILSWKDDYVAPIINDWIGINEYEIPFSWIGLGNYRSIMRKMNTEPSSGILSLVTLLQYEIKELLVTGFSFYSQGGGMQQCYYDSYIVKDVYTGSDPYSNFNPLIGHNQIAQAQFFSNEIIPFYKDKIKIDTFLNLLLQCGHSNLFYV
jgi:hypothetical protein